MENALNDKIRDYCFKLFIEAGEELGVNYSSVMKIELQSAFYAGWRTAKEADLLNTDHAAVDAAIADGE